MDGLSATQRSAAERSRVARLATVSPSGRPHLVPITFALVGDTLVTAVDQKPKSTLHLARLRHIAAQPAVSVLVDHYDDDWAQLWWVRGDGRAEVVEAGPRRAQAVDWLAAKYAAYRHATPPGPVIWVDVERWVTWSP